MLRGKKTPQTQIQIFRKVFSIYEVITVESKFGKNLGLNSCVHSFPCRWRCPRIYKRGSCPFHWERAAQKGLEDPCYYCIMVSFSSLLSCRSINNWAKELLRIIGYCGLIMRCLGQTILYLVEDLIINYGCLINRCWNHKFCIWVEDLIISCCDLIGKILQPMWLESGYLHKYCLILQVHVLYYVISTLKCICLYKSTISKALTWRFLVEMAVPTEYYSRKNNCGAVEKGSVLQYIYR